MDDYVIETSLSNYLISMKYISILFAYEYLNITKIVLKQSYSPSNITLIKLLWRVGCFILWILCETKWYEIFIIFTIKLSFHHIPLYTYLYLYLYLCICACICMFLCEFLCLWSCLCLYLCLFLCLCLFWCLCIRICIW